MRAIAVAADDPWSQFEPQNFGNYKNTMYVAGGRCALRPCARVSLREEPFCSVCASQVHARSCSENHIRETLTGTSTIKMTGKQGVFGQGGAEAWADQMTDKTLMDIYTRVRARRPAAASAALVGSLSAQLCSVLRAPHEHSRQRSARGRRRGRQDLPVHRGAGAGAD